MAGGPGRGPVAAPPEDAPQRTRGPSRQGALPAFYRGGGDWGKVEKPSQNVCIEEFRMMKRWQFSAPHHDAPTEPLPLLTPGWTLPLTDPRPTLTIWVPARLPFRSMKERPSSCQPDRANQITFFCPSALRKLLTMLNAAYCKPTQFSAAKIYHWIHKWIIYVYININCWTVYVYQIIPLNLSLKQVHINYWIIYDRHLISFPGVVISKLPNPKGIIIFVPH